MQHQQHHQGRSSLRDCSSTSNPQSRHNIIKGEIIIVQSDKKSGSGRSASIRIYSCTEVDPKTGKGKLSEQAYLKRGKTKTSCGERTTTYNVKFHVEPNFGTPGALVVRNPKNNRFFLKYAAVQIQNSQIIQFDCYSWVYSFKKTKNFDRIFFSNTKYLPSQTPQALMKLRKEELGSLRGNGSGERKEWDRIYDYDYYNDLGDPDKGPEHKRPVLGGSALLPYPRRGRTGRPSSNADPLTESRPCTTNLDIYVPPDERFSPKKKSEFISNSIQAALHFLILEGKGSKHLESFDEIHAMFSANESLVIEGSLKEKLKAMVPNELYKDTTHAIKKTLKFPLPQILAENEFAWKDDEEFGRQMLAGVNPARIQSLEVFPPQSKHGAVSSIQSSHIEHNLDGLTVAQAMNYWRILILDHHDYLMPFLSRINTNDVCIYASRTLLFLKSDSTLRPLAIELSLPGSPRGNEINRVLVPASQGEAAALWHYAKAHVAVNDSVYHQLVSHWLHTHAVVEPFIIATRRQLSLMHPIHWLLDPHFKDTMHANALARSKLINSGGIFEKILFSAEISMQLSAELYKEWRFDEQALPADLLKRGMALQDPDPDNPTGIQLLFQDYPYGADGLEIWIAIQAWVTDFCMLFYADDASVRSDEEVQAWWSEIRNVGHGDKRNETWWYEMTSRKDLIQALTTLIWIASALHASVNFGQYAYNGYPLNRTTLCRRFIPQEGTFEYAEFLGDPDKYYLNMLPERDKMILGIAIAEVLSKHTSDEVYLGQRLSSLSIKNEEIGQKFEKFNRELQNIEKRIEDKNADTKLKNRQGCAKMPYMLLYPDTSNVESKGGSTGKGIPNSISI
ncbi:linoleate 9S-lipoxygenase 5-like [Rosa rugosa]|uniref:linoleate 9S-lipoxygenase 5-like n=1 Tax=Rosa rugosa TaxID=74645 RepID=UPI002B401A5C|nr:linoleate 9S-lipoxygenase 5-like [Rosa rugosa]